MEDKNIREVLNKLYVELNVDPSDEEYTRYLEEKIKKVFDYVDENEVEDEVIIDKIKELYPSFIEEYQRMKSNIDRKTESLDSNFGISICYQLIELFERANICSNNDEFIKLRDEYFDTLRKDPKLEGHNPIFYGLENITYEDTLKIYDNVIKNVDCITPEMEGKMRFTIKKDAPIIVNGEVNKDAFDFSYLDIVAEFARKNNMQMRMHNIIWHNDFLENFKDLSPEEIYKFLDVYMKEISDRYSDVLYSVDVLNEIASNNEGEVLRDSPWKNKLGDNYFIEVLKIAKNTFKNIDLYYNDYGEQHKDKRDNIMNVVKMIKEVEEEEGITLLDGIALQSHYSVQTTDNEIKDAYRDLMTLGKKLQVSELDVTNKNEKPDYDYQVNRVFRTVLDCATSCNLDLVNIWGVSSNISWKSGHVNDFLDKNNDISKYSNKIVNAYSKKRKLSRTNNINQSL